MTERQRELAEFAADLARRWFAEADLLAKAEAPSRPECEVI